MERWMDRRIERRIERRFERRMRRREVNIKMEKEVVAEEGTISRSS